MSAQHRRAMNVSVSMPGKEETAAQLEVITARSGALQVAEELAQGEVGHDALGDGEDPASEAGVHARLELLGDFLPVGVHEVVHRLS